MHLLELMAMLGAAQGVLLLLLILLRFRSPASFPLAILVLTFSLRLGTIPTWTPQALTTAPWLLPLAGPIPLLFGPMIWWYVREVLRGGGECTARPRLFILHTLPWLVEAILLAAVVYAAGNDGVTALVDDLFTPPAPWWMLTRHAFKVIQGSVYAVAAAAAVFGSWAEEASPKRRLWARAIVLAPMMSMLSFVVVAIQPTVAAGRPFLIPATAMMASVYVFALLAMLSPEALAASSREETLPCGPAIPEEEAQRVAGLVREKLDAGIYQDPDLTLAVLARTLKVHPNRLSRIINREFHKNVTQVIHDSRLDHFIRRVESGGLDDGSILQLAFEAGFPSKTTFNRVFKEHYGVPPSEFATEGRHRHLSSE